MGVMAASPRASGGLTRGGAEEVQGRGGEGKDEPGSDEPGGELRVVFHNECSSIAVNAEVASWVRRSRSVPAPVSELAAQLRLYFFPGGRGAFELRFSAFGEAQTTFAAVFAVAFRDPAAAVHGFEGAGKRGAVDGQDFAEGALGNFTGER